MKAIITAIVCASAVLAVAATASTKTSYTFSGVCAKPEVQSIPAGDKAGHEFAVARGSCTVKDQIAGITASGGTFAESDDVTAMRLKGRGIYVETFANGDKVLYEYRVTFAMSNGVMQSGKAKFKAAGGTGKMTGIDAKGTCAYSPGSNGGVNVTCTGEYAFGGTASTD
jgi:hypothetical protein